jgi:hypothetical protein
MLQNPLLDSLLSWHLPRKTKKNHDKSGQESQPAQQNPMQLLTKHKSMEL